MRHKILICLYLSFYLYIKQIQYIHTNIHENYPELPENTLREHESPRFLVSWSHKTNVGLEEMYDSGGVLQTKISKRATTN